MKPDLGTGLVPFLGAFVIAAVVTVLATPIVRFAAARTGTFARPNRDRWHRRPVPVLGGIAIWLGVMVAVGVTRAASITTLTVVVTGSLMFLTGLIDDFFNTKPNTKLVAQLAVACFAVYFGAQLQWFASPTLNVLVTLLWIIGVTNAFNLLDNMDGLAAGIAALAALTLYVTMQSTAPSVAAFGAAVAGASAAFLIFNFNPASVFMGNCGSLFLGGTLAALALASEPPGKTGILSALAVPVLIMLVPIFDVTFVTLARKLSSRAASVGGRDHTSHRLVALGFSERQAVLLLYGLAAAAGFTAIALQRMNLREAPILLFLLLVSLVLLGVQLARVRVYEGKDFSLLQDAPYARLVEVTYKRRIFEVLLDVGLITLAYYTAYVLRFDRDFPSYYESFSRSLPIVIACKLASLYVAGVYRGVWRYFSPADLATYARAVMFGAATSVIALVYLYRFESFSRSVFVIDAMSLGILLVGSRASFRIFGELASRQRRAARGAVIYGAGDGGALVVRELRNNSRYGLHAVSFFDDDKRKHGRRILGLTVLGGMQELEALLVGKPPDVVIVSTEKLDAERLDRLRGLCRAGRVELLRLDFRLERLVASVEV